MQENAKRSVPGELDEIHFRDELRTLRKQIPDTPGLNPIASVAFDLSRRLEAGKISFEALRALATRIMDRAFVQRARHLRQRVGYIDPKQTHQEFADFVEARAKSLEFDAFAARWSRARNGIVFTAHPTFGLSEALSHRMVELAI